jgi:rubredoxin
MILLWLVVSNYPPLSGGILFFVAAGSHEHILQSVSQKFLFKHIMLDLNMELELDCFECLVCGYVYNPEEGDPAGGIPPGMTFFSLPDDWLCPACSAGKNEFALVEL